MIDRVGEIFGNLQVIGYDKEESDIRSERYGKRTNCWKCKCINCGTEVTKPLSELTHYKNKGLNGCQVCRFPDITGQRFGRLVVLGLGEYNTKSERRRWICQCDCGNIVGIASSHLINTNPNRHTTQSCGCLQKEVAAQRAKGQGIWNGASSQSKRLYGIWDSMHRRCYDPTNKRYKNYGGRGITICDEWMHDFFAFANWSYANGYTEDLTIDRINVDGNYEPTNCKWSTLLEQENNKTTTRFITWHGETHSMSDWSRITNIPAATISNRLKSAYFTLDEALSIPPEDGFAHYQRKKKEQIICHSINAISATKL